MLLKTSMTSLLGKGIIVKYCHARLRHGVGKPNHFQFSVIFCFNAVIFFGVPPNKYKEFHGTAKHQFSAAQKKQMTILFISGGRSKVRNGPELFHQKSQNVWVFTPFGDRLPLFIIAANTQLYYFNILTGSSTK